MSVKLNFSLEIKLNRDKIRQLLSDYERLKKDSGIQYRQYPAINSLLEEIEEIMNE